MFGLVQQAVVVLVGFHQLGEFAEVFLLDGVQAAHSKAGAERAGYGVVLRRLDRRERVQRPQAGDGGRDAEGCVRLCL